MSAWWKDRAALDRVVSDLLSGELARLRPGGAPPRHPRPWPDALEITGEDAVLGLGADSLELLELASALNEALQLHRSGIEDYLLVRRRFGDWLDVATAALERCDEALTFRTSGSTGNGKSCTHPLAALEEEADALARILRNGPTPPSRLLTVVPAHHIYGFLFTVLVPRRLGIPVIDGRGSSPAGLAARMQQGDLVVAHPDWWGALLRSGATLPDGVTGTSSTAPCPAKTAAGLRVAGLSRLVEVFGSSETAGVGWRDDPNKPFQPFAWWRFLEAGRLLRHLEDGTPIRSELQDQLTFGPQGFHAAGRIDTVVQVGGVNVSLDAVRLHLLTHPEVGEATVRLMRPEEGARLKAFIVPVSGGSDEHALRARLTAWIERTMPAAQRPRALTFGASLPVNPLGKRADWTLPPSSVSPEFIT